MGRVVYTDQSGREHAVTVGPDNPVVSIGRATDCTIRSSKKSVSRHHAEVRYEEGTCSIVDLDSSNGTYLIVNGERQPVLSPEELSHNDELWCGDFILYFYEEEREKGRSGGQDPISAGGGGLGGTGGGRKPPGPSGDLGYGGPGFEGAAISTEAPENFGEDLEEVQPDVIGEIDDDPYERIERLEEEKKSVEDLASRQANQIEELREKLEEARTGAGPEELERLETRIEDLEEDNEYLREDVERLTEERDEALERADAEADSADELQKKLDEYEATIESVQRENEHLERQLERAEADAERADEASEQVQELKDEVQRRQDLVEELEGETRELRDEIDRREARADELAGDLEEAESRVESLTERVESLESERDEAEQRVETLEEELERADESEAAYEEEIQGLKQRLSLKRDEQKEARRRRQKLEEENESLREQLESLQNGEEGFGQVPPETAVADNMLGEVRNRAEQLFRMVDAIKRTDFDALSTVDRIRLESAIRETSPQENLEELLDLVGGEPPEIEQNEAE